MSRKRNVTVAAVQMKCSTHVEENIAKADALVREAAEKGAQIILLPELFERQYFCQGLLLCLPIRIRTCHVPY